MSDQKQNVLFVCTGNSARSILAEGILSHFGADRFEAFSAGSHPKGAVNPLAVTTLKNLRVADRPYRSKNWSEYVQEGAPHMDFVITVCDQAAGEVCPMWPGQPVSAHWGLPDPAAVEGTEEVKREAFAAAAFTLKRRIELFLSLPMTKLATLAIQQEVRAIGSK